MIVGTNVTDLFHLIYTSEAVRLFSPDDLLGLLKASRRNNRNLDVSGMLLHANGSFFQVLEGPEEAVVTLFQKISLDSRHAKATTIIQEPISRRFFANWTMGFTDVTPEELARIDGSNDFFDSASCFAGVDSGRAKKLLQAFRQGRWRTKLSIPAGTIQAA